MVAGMAILEPAQSPPAPPDTAPSPPAPSPAEPVQPQAVPPPAPAASRTRTGLFGGPVSSRQPRSRETEDAGKKQKTPIAFRAVMRDAVDLVRARKGRLALGLALMAVSRGSGPVLPRGTKSLPA